MLAQPSSGDHPPGGVMACALCRVAPRPGPEGSSELRCPPTIGRAKLSKARRGTVRVMADSKLLLGVHNRTRLKFKTKDGVKYGKVKQVDESTFPGRIVFDGEDGNTYEVPIEIGLADDGVTPGDD